MPAPHSGPVPGASISVTVHLPDGSTICVDKVSSDVTAGLLLSRLLGLPQIKPIGTPHLTSMSSRLIQNDELLENNEYALVFVLENKLQGKSIFFAVLFVATYIVSFLLCAMHSLRIGLLVLLTMLIVNIVLIKKMEPDLRSVTSTDPNENPLAEFVCWLFKSLSKHF
jgi:hypothetical protein